LMVSVYFILTLFSALCAKSCISAACLA
jgi:hypothetical protein